MKFTLFLPPTPSEGGESVDFQCIVSPFGGGWGEENTFYEKILYHTVKHTL